MSVQRRWMAALGLLALALLIGIRPGQTQPPAPAPDVVPAPAPAPQQDGVDIQAHGPVHEAYAGPVGGEPQPTPVINKQPPGPIEEIPADQKPPGDRVQWIPGYWGWDQDRADYVWVSGFWRTPPPGREWMPGNWHQVAGGWQWVGGYWNTHQAQDVSYLPPPPAQIQAAPPPAPNPNSVFVPGNWVWNGERYVWRPGVYVNYQPGWVWIPASYVWTPAGYVFVEGYWDYPLRERGLLFAPAAIQARVYARPGFVYQPSFVIADESLYGSLFVHPGYRHYYYGDYFDVRYRNGGYVAWCDYNYGRWGYDPLFSYYRWHYRDDPRWVVDLRGCYVGRYNGTIARPPLVIGIEIGGRPGNRFAAVGIVVPVGRLGPGYRLEHVSREAQMRHIEAARHFQAVSAERREHEVRIAAARPAGGGFHATPQTAKFSSVRNAPAARPVTPPHPMAPHPAPPHPAPPARKVPEKKK